MGRHRQPEVLAELRGLKRQNPGRYGNTPTSPYALGAPPAHLSDEARAVWMELEAYALEGVLKGSDRIVLEVASVLVAQFRKDPVEFAAAKMTHMIGVLARLGLSPADRQRLNMPDRERRNAFDEL